jgi:hypothetical protein
MKRFDFLAPLGNTRQSQFLDPSKAIIRTILVGRNQVKDGFLANDSLFGRQRRIQPMQAIVPPTYLSTSPEQGTELSAPPEKIFRG